MKKRNLKTTITISCLLITSSIFSQNIGINATGLAPAASAGLDVNFTNKGLLIPRIALTGTADALTITTPATSLLVYNTATAGISPNNVIPGYYYWNATKWIAFGGSGGRDWSLTGNAGTTVGTNYIGTSDAKDLVFKTNANEQMRINTSGFLGINETNPTGAYLVIRSANSANDGVKSTHTSGSAGAAYNAVSGTLSNAAYINATGYLGYHNSFNKTYGVYGTGGNLAGYFDGLVGINSISTDLPAHDMEIRNNLSANPVQLLLRKTNQATAAGSAMANIDFGDSFNKLGQASIKVIRDMASAGATDLPTAFTFSTTADATSVLTERMRITNAGFVGIGTVAPRRPLDVNGEIVAVNRLTLAQDIGTTTETWHLDNSGGTFRIFNQPNINTSGTERLIITTTGNVGIGKAAPKSKLAVVGLPIYANNLAATTGGLTVGDFYRTGGDPDLVCVVH